MAEPFNLTEELRKAILGKQSEPTVHEVEQSAIRRFADAIGDPNPLWNDEVEARRSHYGGIIAPPTFLRSFSGAVPEVPELNSLTRILDGGSGWEYFEPVRPGDTITTVNRVANLSQRTLSVGLAVFIVMETTYTNQLDQVVAKQRSTLIRY